MKSSMNKQPVVVFFSLTIERNWEVIRNHNKSLPYTVKTALVILELSILKSLSDLRNKNVLDSGDKTKNSNLAK